jgi:L-ornithine Nalpha-acyltransferase
MNAVDRYEVRLARSEDDLLAAQRLRYQVFVAELGADGPLVDHKTGLERDEFDDFFDHLILVDPSLDPGRRDHVVGVYRLLTCDRMAEMGRFYSEDEYDLGPLKATGRRLLELGRSCIHPDHRGGMGMFHLWNALSDYILARDIEILFGTASFHGTDTAALAQPLSFLWHNHLAPEALRVVAHGVGAAQMRLLEPDQIDLGTAMGGIPALIKAYLRLGGFVGDGAFVDSAFNTTDVCLVMDTARMSAKHRNFYTRSRSLG